MDVQQFVEESVRTSTSRLVDSYLQTNMPRILGEHLLDVCSVDEDDVQLALINIVNNRVDKIIETVDTKYKSVEKRVRDLETSVATLTGLVRSQNETIKKLSKPKRSWWQFW